MVPVVNTSSNPLREFWSHNNVEFMKLKSAAVLSRDHRAVELLYHAFPRPPANRTAGYVEDVEGALRTLSSLLKNGMMCSPEPFDIYSDPNSERPNKRNMAKLGVPYRTMTQSRACFTLLDRYELTREVEVSRGAGESGETKVQTSHADLFGRFVIGIDPLEARQLGILPVHYYYRSVYDGGVKPEGMKEEGLGSYIISRLEEIRSILCILSHVEALSRPGDAVFFTMERLNKHGIKPIDENKVSGLLGRMSKREARRIYDVFDTDRVRAWSLGNAIDMLWSLYQTTDSYITGEPLAFFRQREWRLIHHMRSGMRWYSLGSHEPSVDTHAHEFRSERKSMRELLSERFGTLNEKEMQFFWVLAEVGRLPFRDFVREVVVPEEYRDRAEKVVLGFSYNSAPPRVMALPLKWRLNAEQRTLT
jgi:hypothetical protein